jgi:signal transduction histidine kinase
MTGDRLRTVLRDRPEPRPPGRALRVAVALAALLLGLTGWASAGDVVDLARTGAGTAPFLGAAAGLPVLLALRRPLPGWVLSAGSALLVATLPLVDADPWPWPVPHGLALLGLLFAVAARETLARAAAAWLGSTVLVATVLRPDLRAGWIFAVTAAAVIGALGGRLVRSNRRLARQSAQVERDKARRVVLEERARIARDLHDVVAHHMSLVAVRAETAPYRNADLSEAARAELAAIGDTARAALAETRTLLTVLRSDGGGSEGGSGTDDPADRAPQPDLGRLDALVDATRRAGVRVEARVDGPLDDLRPGTSLAAYRIAQEALANATRHAPGSTVRLTVRREAEAVALRVTNDHPAAAPTPGSPGHGITGMRERARAEGGDLTVAHTPDGRFTVEARLPAAARP